MWFCGSIERWKSILGRGKDEGLCIYALSYIFFLTRYQYNILCTYSSSNSVIILNECWHAVCPQWLFSAFKKCASYYTRRKIVHLVQRIRELSWGTEWPISVLRRRLRSPIRTPVTGGASHWAVTVSGERGWFNPSPAHGMCLIEIQPKTHKCSKIYSPKNPTVPTNQQS